MGDSSRSEDEQHGPTWYIAKRLEQYQGWYDTKAVKTKRMYLWMRTVSVVGGVLVPVILNIDGNWARVLATATSLLVAVAVALESVYRYRDQWKNYRSTEQILGHERIHFLTRTGLYQALDDAAAYRALVERVEGAIQAENIATLNVMTLMENTQSNDDRAAGPGSPNPPAFG
ncbi:hypothetical protein Val02_42630 [Virgisporangium aliadipatigenens]|uniref:DUF4231 domain-containing protein n=1 Tax=Virgisporangium aliadipatigenens TaxID=741659 RepID=A0A8J3YN37_9ACTN|nr:DUF4231 domain-containing protein [Virgisporangium aliadipatigenens]GIJ47377.1 hypothetical protein Val02_42630 [Virgisporangium aliadipatigenens]